MIITQEANMEPDERDALYDVREHEFGVPLSALVFVKPKFRDLDRLDQGLTAITSRRPVEPSVYLRNGDSAREPVGKIKRLHCQHLKRPRSVYKLSNYNLR